VGLTFQLVQQLAVEVLEMEFACLHRMSITVLLLHLLHWSFVKPHSFQGLLKSSTKSVLVLPCFLVLNVSKPTYS